MHYFPCAETDFMLFQEILEEVRKELQKVKEEIIGGQFNSSTQNDYDKRIHFKWKK